MKSHLVSIVVPIYNAEKYLGQCIESILDQDIGFKKNIELVLVNDGSEDSSAEICKEYQKQFPKNINYIEQENAGASEARNVGIEEASGEYIGFVDADDYISKETLSSVASYFETAPTNVDVAVVRVILFGEKNTERPINKKFEDGTRTIDLLQPQWFDICPRVAPAFIRSEVAKRHKFEKSTRFYEDSRYMGDVLSENMKLGVIDEGIYFNRKHEEDNRNASITTGATTERRFYTDSPEKVSLYLLEKYKDIKTGLPHVYFQYLALYEIRWRMFYNQNSPKEVLSTADYTRYRKVNKKILDLISDKTLVDFKLNNVWQRVYLLNRKHQKDILTEAVYNKKGKLTWCGLVIFNHMKKMQARISSIKEADGNILIEGYFLEFIFKDITVKAKINSKLIEDFTLRHHAIETTATKLEDKAYKRTSYKIKIPVDSKDIRRIKFIANRGDKTWRVKRVSPYPMRDIYEQTPTKIRLEKNIVIIEESSIIIFPNNFISKMRFSISAVRDHLLIWSKERG